MRAGSFALALGVGALIAAAPAWSAPADDAADDGAATAARSGGIRAHLGAKPRAPRSDIPAAGRLIPQAPPAAVQAPGARVVAAVSIPAAGSQPPESAVAGPAPQAPPAPAESPLDWAVLAAARRPAVAAVQASAQAAATNPIGELLFNQKPALHPTRTGQDSFSVVTGDLTIDDPDSTAVTYTVTTAPVHGTVSVDADGRYTYTPDAVYARIGTTDNFAVSVSDAASGFHIHGLGGLLNLLTFGLLGDAGHASTAPVTVVVDPRNTAPEGTASTADPDPATGRVTGRVIGTDGDGDPLTYTGTATTAKGAVTVAADGTFSYTPTATARHDAAAAVATAVDRTDTFTVTVRDGYGGTTSVPVVVAVSPLNVAPVGGVGVGPPDPSTGRVTGQVSATDADGDPLTYSGPTATAKGTVSVAADGTFSYTPTAAACHDAAAVNATVATKTDTFTVTVSDGSGGSTGVAVSVEISPRNAAPVPGAAVVGTPNATSGVVAGSVTATDADGDGFSYSASTPGKGSVSMTANGAFSYTPTETARQAAAAAGATDADKADAFTVTVADGYGGSVAIPVSVAVAAAVAPPAVPVVSFGFNYGAGAQYWAAEARSALESTAASLASYLVVGTPVTITVNVTGINSPSSGTLAYASTDFTGSGAGIYRTVSQSEILTGADSNGGTADASITYNWSYAWALGDTVTGSQYDFKAVALHELLHALGILSGTGDPASLDRNWLTYDSFLSTSTGVRVVGNNYTVDAAYLANFTGGNGGLYFAGPNAVAAYGGPVPLYTPASWGAGSSVSHLNQLSSYVMNPYLNRGLGIRVLTPVEVSMLRDIGFTVRDTPLVYAFILLGLVRRRRR